MKQNTPEVLAKEFNSLKLMADSITDRFPIVATGDTIYRDCLLTLNIDGLESEKFIKSI